jgi:ABC-type oligopeptide transport system substrate-binding subunit
MAALATHFEASPEQDQFTFYLRGHPAPRGVRLPDSDTLPDEFTRGQSAAPAAIPARWSDGRPIKAHDFVYSWRRFLDPATAAPMAYQLYYVANAEEVNTGKLHPRKLGARALDDFTFQVDLRSPAPFFLQLITQYIFNAVPRQAVEAARQRGNEASWTEPEYMVVSGAFALRQWRRHEIITAVRNPRYYDSAVVGLDGLNFLPIVDGTTTINLYRSGAAFAMPGPSFPPLFTPILARKKDFHTEPAFGTVCPAISVRRPPLDNVLLRYALNMATEKKPFTDLLGAGEVPAVNMVPPITEYPAPRSVSVNVDGHSYDILSFNVRGARALLTKAGFEAGTGHNPHTLDLAYHFPVLPETKLKAEMLQQQWRHHLGIRLNLTMREFSLHWKMVFNGDFSGVADCAFLPTYFDPNPYLDPFVTAGTGNPSGWTDPEYCSMLVDANRTLDTAGRMKKLARCEERLLRAMPVLPLYFDTWAYLQKPFVRGLTSNLFDIRAFKYVWIDTNWKPQ